MQTVTVLDSVHISNDPASIRMQASLSYSIVQFGTSYRTIAVLESFQFSSTARTFKRPHLLQYEITVASNIINKSEAIICNINIS